MLREMEPGFDSLVSVFLEESHNPQTGEVTYVNHNQDSTFVHGKIHRRKYLIDNNIRFNPDLTIHEDSYFNILAQNCSQNVKYCPTPFYLWKWRDDSVCRHDPKYILKTFTNMLDSTDALLKQFELRGMFDKLAFFTAFTIFDTYYLMNKPEWINQENKEYRDKTEKRFAQWFKKHRDHWDKMNDQEKMIVSNSVRSRHVMEGMGMETITITEWLKQIEELAD